MKTIKAILCFLNIHDDTLMGFYGEEIRFECKRCGKITCI